MTSMNTLRVDHPLEHPSLEDSSLPVQEPEILLETWVLSSMEISQPRLLVVPVRSMTLAILLRPLLWVVVPAKDALESTALTLLLEDAS